MRTLLQMLLMVRCTTSILHWDYREEFWLRAAVAEQLNGQVAELVVGSLQLMVGHMVGTRVVPQAHNRQVMRWGLVEQECPVPAAAVAATGAATADHNMAAVVAVLVGQRATSFLLVTRRAIAVEMASSLLPLHKVHLLRHQQNSRF